MKQVIVRRKTWYRGQGSDNSYLLRADGLMCCIGFLAKAFGVSNKSIRNVPTLGRVKLRPALTRFDQRHKLALDRAYNVNDNASIDDAFREMELVRIGEGMDILFSFRG